MSILKEYFSLQYAILNRKISDFGLHPIIGYFLSIAVFISLSIYLLGEKNAAYLYVFIALVFTSRLSKIDRNDFLKICFEKKLYRRIRVYENMAMVLPFAMILVCFQQFYPLIILVAIAIVLALFNFKATYNFTLPTPFYKKPFEFTIGFRNTFFMFFIAYGLTGIAIVVHNFNLGIFSIALSFLTVCSYYLKPENDYLVWAYRFTPSRFLIEKIKTAFLFSSYLCSPIALALSLFYIQNIVILLLSILLGYVYLSVIILAKYAAYPAEIDFIRAIMIALTFLFPPLVIILIPLFAKQSLYKLKNLLA
ncbi:MAG: hypothetical protein LBU91_03820 [Bacteroidales bacterium]|jgi:hypothetical protein|nr:hypothetical protein [Bacteroidales bacterium]